MMEDNLEEHTFEGGHTKSVLAGLLIGGLAGFAGAVALNAHQGLPAIAYSALWVSAVAPPAFSAGRRHPLTHSWLCSIQRRTNTIRHFTSRMVTLSSPISLGRWSSGIEGG